MYLIINEVAEYFEDKNGTKYLILDFTDKNNEALKKYTKLCHGNKSSIEKRNNILDDYANNYMKIKFNSDDTLPLNKTLKLHNITTIIRSAFKKDGIYYP